MTDYSDILFMMAAMVLFSILVNNANRSFVRNTVMDVETQIEYNAISLGQSVIEEARNRAFDEVAVDGGSELGNPGLLTPAQIPSAFTPPVDLGPETGESYPDFNDFDDFNGLAITRSNGFGDFDIAVQVFFVDPANSTVNAGTRTTMKRMEVTISHESMSNTVTLSYLRSYF